ncbi:MAG: hypothetical protein F6J96_15945 [Symploca sp. SIO1C2]|nr:hypothetical protein [Symploca sp. SIO1C2]
MIIHHQPTGNKLKGGVWGAEGAEGAGEAEGDKIEDIETRQFPFGAW